MEERIVKQIERLVGMRDEVFALYLTALDSYSSQDGSMDAVERAGILHDLDKHITNLELEMKRIEALKVVACA